MQKCPNCGQAAMRTEDWVCQWCGYPLLSGAFRKIPKTFRELREERSPRLSTVLDTRMPAESAIVGMPVETPAPQPEPEPVYAAEAPEVDESADEPAAVEAEAELPPEVPALESAVEMTPEPPAAPRKPGRKKAVKAEVAEEKAPEAAAPPESTGLPDLAAPSGKIAVTVDELGRAFQEDKTGSNEALDEKSVRVTGIIDKVVVRDHLEIRYVLLTGANKANPWNVRCSFGAEHSQALFRLARAEAVTVQGIYKGYERNILLKDCAIIA